MLTAISRYGARVLPNTEELVAGCKARGEFIQGPQIAEFEAAFAGRHGAAAAGAPRKRFFEADDVRALNELAAGLAARGDLFGIGQDSRTVARDGGQHATGREQSAISSRECRSFTRRSIRVTQLRIIVFWIFRKFARYDGRT